MDEVWVESGSVEVEDMMEHGIVITNWLDIPIVVRFSQDTQDVSVEVHYA